MTRSSTIASARRSRHEPLPACVAPMLAVLSELPSDGDDFAYEFKWDGVRAITRWDGSQFQLLSRNLLDITNHYPELHALGRAMGRRRVMLDGEIVALTATGIPSFPLLQRRMHVNMPEPSLVRRIPVTYLLFDVLYAHGRSMLDVPYTARRELLEELTLKGASWEVPPSHFGAEEGATMLAAARATGLEGVVAKRLKSIYSPGRRSPDWLKIKVVMEQEFVIGGWVPEGGNVRTRVGSLLLGYYDCTGDRRALRFAGGVGSGFSDATHARLVSQLSPLSRPDCPFADRIPKANALFVRPELVAQVEFRRWPEGGMIHQASFKGLRNDKSPRDVVKEWPTGSGK